MQLSNAGRSELVKMGKDEINEFVVRGWVMGVKAHDRSISPTALQFIVRLSLPFTGCKLTWCPLDEWWAKACNICLGCNMAVVMALVWCLRGRNAFIIIVPFGDQKIKKILILFHLFWRQQENKWDIKGLREHFLQTGTKAYCSNSYYNILTTRLPWQVAS